MKDYESKKRLSVIFAENYPLIVDDYLRDDQEKDASIMSLSVQIFTVPSLALHLIEHCDAMAKLIQGFQVVIDSVARENFDNSQISMLRKDISLKFNASKSEPLRIHNRCIICNLYVGMPF